MTECAECGAWERLAKADPGRAVQCGCGAEWIYTAPPPREVLVPVRRSQPPPPSYVLDATPVHRWRWTPDVKLDMAALAWTPGSGEPPPGWLVLVEEAEAELTRELREDRRTTRRVCARRRLDSMCAKSRHGARMAAVVWYVYGCRGEALNERESCAAMVTDRFATKAERAAFRAALERTGSVKADVLAAAAHVGLGNAMVGAAVAAYEHDQWNELVVAPGVSTAPARKSKHQQFVESMLATYIETTAAIDDANTRRTREAFKALLAEDVAPSAHELKDK